MIICSITINKKREAPAEVRVDDRFVTNNKIIDNAFKTISLTLVEMWLNK